MTAPIRTALFLVVALTAAGAPARSDVVFSYDQNGNLTRQVVEGVATEYSYDVQNRLVEVRRGSNILVRFQYDAEDRIVKRIGAQGIRQYVYDGEHIEAEYNENGILVASYSWGRDQLISINRPGQPALFPQHDGLGSIVALADSEGNVVARYHYDAWGGLRFPEELTTDPNRFGFTGHRWDEEIGLVSAPARRFDPALGRFTTQDSYLGQPENPLSLHRYLYGSANPTRYTDPTGHWSWEDIWEGVKGLPRAVAEPALWVYDTTLVAGAKALGVSPEHIELQSALGRRQQQRIEEGQSAGVAATKGAIEAPLAVFSAGTTAVAQGHYELYQSFSKGEITLDEYDRQLSRMAGGQIGAAVAGGGVSRAAGRTWTGRSVQEASTTNTAHVVVEGNRGNVLVPIEGAPPPVEPVPPSLPRVAGASQGAEPMVADGTAPPRGVPGGARAERLAGSKLEHMNASVAEAHGYNSMLERGYQGIRAPGKTTRQGADSIAFDPTTREIVVQDAKYRGPAGTYPSKISAEKLQRWGPDIRRSIEALPDGPLKDAARRAFEDGMIRPEVFRWPQ